MILAVLIGIPLALAGILACYLAAFARAHARMGYGD